MLDEELPAFLLNLFRYSVLVVTKMQRLKSEETQAVFPKQLPSWLVDLTSCIKSNEPSICNSSIEGLIFVIST